MGFKGHGSRQYLGFGIQFGVHRPSECEVYDSRVIQGDSGDGIRLLTDYDHLGRKVDRHFENADVMKLAKRGEAR